MAGSFSGLSPYRYLLQHRPTLRQTDWHNPRPPRFLRPLRAPYLWHQRLARLSLFEHRG